VQVIFKEEVNKVIVEINNRDSEFAALILENRLAANSVTIDYEHSGGSSKNTK
jgi:hypothetical protein